MIDSTICKFSTLPKDFVLVNGDLKFSHTYVLFP